MLVFVEFPGPFSGRHRGRSLLCIFMPAGAVHSSKAWLQASKDKRLVKLPAKFSYLCSMKILLLGSGGREHALAWKMAQSSLCTKLYVAPGNPGMATLGTFVSLSVEQFDEIGRFVREEEIELVVVGPEAPLVAGLADYFDGDPALRQTLFIGPGAAGARLEGSKDFAKAFMQRHHIPTAAYRTFDLEERQQGLDYLAKAPLPVVLKADGLAAGKGVVICEEREEALSAFRQMLDGRFGEAGRKVVVEEFLSGREFSVFVLTDGRRYALLPQAKDYKRIGEGDTGPNTGGMGAISPVPFLDKKLMQKVEERIIKPTIQGLQKEKIPYLGFIFFGLMEVAGEPYVIEYNCRLGDPETEAVLPRLDEDLVLLMKEAATATGRFAPEAPGSFVCQTDRRFAATVVLVSGGYPGNYSKGLPISHWQEVQDVLLFQAGTRMENGRLLTNGGRVLALTALHETFEGALEIAQKAAERIYFEGKYFRRDIGQY